MSKDSGCSKKCKKKIPSKTRELLISGDYWRESLQEKIDLRKEKRMKSVKLKQQGENIVWSQGRHPISYVVLPVMLNVPDVERLKETVMFVRGCAW